MTMNQLPAISVYSRIALRVSNASGVHNGWDHGVSGYLHALVFDLINVQRLFSMYYNESLKDFAEIADILL